VHLSLVIQQLTHYKPFPNKLRLCLEEDESKFWGWIVQNFLPCLTLHGAGSTPYKCRDHSSSGMAAVDTVIVV